MAEEQRRRGTRPRTFFTAPEQEAIVEAIRDAELATSGEIRLHVERDVPSGGEAGGDPYRRARQVFAGLGMHRTAERNGVLVYLAVRDRRFAVVGDEELHRRVGDGFWDEVVQLMAERFREDDFAGGLGAGIRLIGEKLREHFPHRPDDVNELPDDISFRE